MQSKTHYKKCIELGLKPGPMPPDSEFPDGDFDMDQQSTTSASGRTSSIPGESDSEDYSDNESESSGKRSTLTTTTPPPSTCSSSCSPTLLTQSLNVICVDAEAEAKSRLQEHEAARSLLSLSMTPPIAQSVSPQLKTEHYAYQQYQQQAKLSNTLSVAVASSAPTTTTTTIATTKSAVSTTSPTVAGIKRVVSFTSPKPPFDYQKQEQYYSNPEESKPKRSTNNSFESAPMDLTKPRSTDVITPTSCKSPSMPINVESSTTAMEIYSMPGPVQTQAQIRDVIFGSSNNESGFLKTLYSVSDKVRVSSSLEPVEDNKKINESELLQAYLTEQALQYTKIKQSQMSRSFQDMSSGLCNGLVNTMNTKVETSGNASNLNSIWSVVSNAKTTEPSAVTLTTTTTATPTPTTTTTTATLTVDDKKVEAKTMEIPSIKVTEVKVGENKENTCKSSDEGEESESSPSDHEQLSLTKSSSTKSKSNHNANLPAAVQQPGTTDFSGVLASSSAPPTRTVIIGTEDVFKKSTNNEIQPVYTRGPMAADGRSVCTICSKSFQKQHQLVLHMNIHYMERKFKCEPCAVSFRTQGHLQKHERSEAHKNKVMMTSTFGVPTTSNPRPFECTDCKIAFRIHGHLAKHLRSKTHVQKLECLQKLPFGTYAEIERAGISLTEIDTSDCDNSLISLKLLAQKLMDKDPTKLGTYTTPSGGISDSNCGLGSQDSTSEDGFSAAASAAANAIASLDNDSAATTPQRGNSTSEDESMVASTNLKRRLPASFSNADEDSNTAPGSLGECEKRPKLSEVSEKLEGIVSPSSATN